MPQSPTIFMMMGRLLPRLSTCNSLLTGFGASTLGSASLKQNDLELNKPYGIITAQPMIAKDCGVSYRLGPSCPLKWMPFEPAYRGHYPAYPAY